MLNPWHVAIAAQPRTMFSRATGHLKLHRRHHDTQRAYFRLYSTRLFSSNAISDGEMYTSLRLRRAPLRAVDWDQFNVTAEEPILFKESSQDRRDPSSRASELLSALSQGEDRIVEVEVGRYDSTRPDGFHQVPMRLRKYLDWLQSDRADGRIGGQQVYLAQWSGHDEIKAVRDTALPPSVLSGLITEEKVDLYQSALFLGPTGAVTPLHFDPYINLFHLQASSNPEEYVKHVILLPPTASRFVKGPHAQRRQHNTSALEFQIHRDASHDISGFRVETSLDGTSDVREIRDVIERYAVTCLLRQGETLLIPRGWWHRVENVGLRDGRREHCGWTAGLSWWFLSRSSCNESTRALG
ncbi:hypothetical protein BC835DRAFT_854813 [Cytidiella melzeri]|nr:hypothetical protein BC835DRAFT_854813 [Cytidiella melzeri]